MFAIMDSFVKGKKGWYFLSIGEFLIENKKNDFDMWFELAKGTYSAKINFWANIIKEISNFWQRIFSKKLTIFHADFHISS